MRATRLKILLGVLAVLFAAGAALSWFYYGRLAAAAREALGGQALKKIGREARFSGLGFSPVEGVWVSDLCLSRRGGFAAGEFFCAARLSARPRPAGLFGGELRFSQVTLAEPRLKTRENGGAWDFADLLALLPENKEGLHMSWNADELLVEGGLLEAELGTSGRSLALENARLRLRHYSGRGGHYGLEASGLFKTALAGRLLQAAVQLETDTNFEAAGPSSSKGEFTASGVSFGAASLEKFEADWALFGLLKTLPEKKYALSVEAAGLLVPRQEGGARDAVAKALEVFAAAMGRPAPRIDDLQARSFTADFRLDDRRLRVDNFEFDSDFLRLDADLSIDGPAKTSAARLEAAIGPTSVKLLAEGPLGSPRLRPALSDTLSKKLKQALASLEAALLGVFPVTGE